MPRRCRYASPRLPGSAAWNAASCCAKSGIAEAGLRGTGGCAAVLLTAAVEHCRCARCGWVCEEAVVVGKGKGRSPEQVDVRSQGLLRGRQHGAEDRHDTMMALSSRP